MLLEPCKITLKLLYQNMVNLTINQVFKIPLKLLSQILIQLILKDPLSLSQSEVSQFSLEELRMPTLEMKWLIKNSKDL